ncbi:MAG: hypothetical protein ACQETE_10095 [Bacteroidota bacterium]
MADRSVVLDRDLLGIYMFDISGDLVAPPPSASPAGHVWRPWKIHSREGD